MISVEEILPRDAESATLVGRVFDPESQGPCVVVVDGTEVVEITDVEPTVSTLFEREDLHDAVASARAGRRRWSLEQLAAAFADERDRSVPRLLSPIDLQVIKAAGVTFVESMIERVIEERAKGDASRAVAIREQLAEVVGGAISAVKPGTESAVQVKEVLLREGLWSQYLEVGIGPDPEIFTKAPVLSSVGTGQSIGVLSRSSWNNPEPEVVLAVRSDGTPVGATLGNDVNLRDFEGRSALLLTEAKDNNASCAIGPFVRLFDDAFGMDDVRDLDVTLTVTGEDGFVLDGASSMKNISRDPVELIHHAYGDHHQYPDGFVLFTGTLFAPTQDRFAPGAGFTHLLGDVVRIATPRLGVLVNTVDHAESAPRWEAGIWALVKSLRARGLV
ncbi:fumarylacetoacetate hydrolase family protein [Microtetraspora glauca]|uniref:Fumarylacetoacetate hydrolase family protein n=1 Tax=Microtetraspora glauca TaxID=1996 RepID=A0ABV3G9C2_MICGL